MSFFEGLQGGKPGSRTGLATGRGPVLKAVPVKWANAREIRRRAGSKA
ncbi:hypothetical protein [Pararhizobium sp. LjRoot238]